MRELDHCLGISKTAFQFLIEPSGLVPNSFADARHRLGNGADLLTQTLCGGIEMPSAHFDRPIEVSTCLLRLLREESFQIVIGHRPPV